MYKRQLLGRSGDSLWLHAPGKDFGVVGRPGVPRFAAEPEVLDETRLEPFALPVPRAQLALAAVLFAVEGLPGEEVGGVPCHVLAAEPRERAVEKLGVPEGRLQLWVRQGDLLPARIGFADGEGLDVLIELEDVSLGAPWPAERWAVSYTHLTLPTIYSV